MKGRGDSYLAGLEISISLLAHPRPCFTEEKGSGNVLKFTLTSELPYAPQRHKNLMMPEVENVGRFQIMYDVTRESNAWIKTKDAFESTLILKGAGDSVFAFWTP